MAVENITLNLIPTGDTPSIHVAQFDVDRSFNVTLKEGEDDFTPTGYDIELQVRKVDSTIVTVLPTQTSGNVVTFNTTEQMTACSGTNIAELQLTKDSQTFATLHFYLVVQRDVLAGGVTSESDIYNLTEQIAEIVPEVIGDGYYNKEEVDEKIAEIPTFDPTNYYDKSDVNALLNAKADVSDLPDMTDYYTKSEVDTKITDLYQIKTASGSIVHITDGGNAIPVKSLVSQIVAMGGGGTLDSPIAISGFDSGVIARCGVNLFGGTYNNNYQLFISKNTQFTISAVVSGSSNLRFAVFDKNEQLIDYWAVLSIESGRNYRTFNLPYDVHFVKFYYADSAINLQIAFGTDTQYHAYNGNNYTFTFGQTVYGGHFDNKGNLVVTHGYIASYNGEPINEPWISSMDNYVPNTSPSTGAQVVYPLTTPTTLSITSQDIPTLLGENNIFSNTGDVEVQYFTSKSDGIAELIKAFM